MMKNAGLDTSTKSFEEVYKTSYSHGLESIYRIENIDLKTVRKLGVKEEKPSKEPSKAFVLAPSRSSRGACAGSGTRP